MTYLSGSLKKRRQYRRYAILGAIFLVFVISWSFIKTVLFGVLEPAVLGYSNVKTSFSIFPEFFQTYITSHRLLVQKQKELELEVERLENSLAEKEALLREESLLRENDAEASLSTSSSFGSVVNNRPIIMYPLMQDVTKIYSTVLLSKGFKDGIVVGSFIYLRGNQVVCTVKEVYTSSSLCSLLSASGVETEGVTSSSSIALSLVGRGGYFLANVARDTPVEIGEKVYLRSNPSMVLGTVKRIANNNQDTSWHIFVEGAYNPIASSVFYARPQ